ncbi:MAG TPA: electron transfer flavoprotein subunit alpha/FixB family protein, partial [Thermoanaerobaculia bacterium]
AEAVVLGFGGEGAAIAAAAADLAKADLAAVHTADHEALRAYTPGGWIGALAPALKEAQPAFVVFPHTYQSVDFVPRLAQTVGAGLLPEVTGFAENGGGLDSLEWTRPILGGKMQAKVRVKGEGTVLVSVQSGAFPADGVVSGGGAAPVQPLAADLSGLKPDREVLGYEEVAGDQIDLTKADIILAVGRGIGGADKMGPVQELAKALGAEIGASRPVIDNGWLPRDRQIGSSGQTVAPKLYIAAGISGAIQHLVGMKGSSVVVAINKDPGAPIFTVAHYGIVGDLHEILPALTEAVRAAKQ